jgi:hypothetical protein
MAIHVALATDSLAWIRNPEVRAAAADCRVRADGYLFDLTGLSGSEWVPACADPYLVLGTVTEDEQICLDARTGAIISWSTWDHDAQRPANQNLASFAGCLDIFEDSLPFYEKEQGYSVTSAVAARFADAIRRLGDDTIDDPTSFWQMIIHDIESGDYNAADLELE